MYSPWPLLFHTTTRLTSSATAQTAVLHPQRTRRSITSTCINISRPSTAAPTSHLTSLAISVCHAVNALAPAHNAVVAIPVVLTSAMGAPSIVAIESNYKVTSYIRARCNPTQELGNGGIAERMRKEEQERTLVVGTPARTWRPFQSCQEKRKRLERCL